MKYLSVWYYILSIYILHNCLASEEKNQKLFVSKTSHVQAVKKSSYFKIICYYAEWAALRPHAGVFYPENINVTLCTHIIFGNAVFDPDKFTVQSKIPLLDYDRKFYERITGLRKNGVKVLLSLGGWLRLDSNYYNRLIHSPLSRRTFIDDVINFIEKHAFDGLDLDWKFSTYGKNDCGRRSVPDKEAFAILTKELSEKFKARKFLLSASVSAMQLIDKDYHLPTLTEYLDWIALMTTDFSERWNRWTTHISPLYDDNARFYSLNVNYTVNYWISKGAPRNKLIIGIPFYGQSYSINNPSTGTGLHVPATAGIAGEFTQSDGLLAYYEICDRIKHRAWAVIQDDKRRMGPYAFKGNQWVSFDDDNIIKTKAHFIRNMKLGGAMVWSIDLDDFRGSCGEKYPLINALVSVLHEPLKSLDEPPIIEEARPSLSIPALDTVSSPSTVKVNQKSEDYKIVCYFTNRAVNRLNDVEFLPENIDTDLCTHIIYSYAILTELNFNIIPSNYQQDIEEDLYKRVTALKNNGIKILIAIRGLSNLGREKHNELLQSDNVRKLFIDNLIKFIEEYKFDGLDIDWSYPICSNVSCERDIKFYKQQYILMIEELSKVLKVKNLILTTALSPNKQVIDNSYDIPILMQYFDWITVQPYELHKSFNHKIGHVSPLYKHPNLPAPRYNANYSINYWLDEGIPPRKILLGFPFFGNTFTLAHIHEISITAAYGPGEPGEFTETPGVLAYYEICLRILKGSWTVIRDKRHRIGPYAFDGDQWISFDDPQQVKRKAEFIKNRGLAGASIWTVDMDDFMNLCGCEPNSLLRTIAQVLTNYPEGSICHLPSSNINDEELHSEIKTLLENESAESEVLSMLSQIADQQNSECVSGMTMAHNEDCAKYLLCNGGKIVEMKCADSLYWNDGYCDLPKKSRCKMRNINNEESNSVLYVRKNINAEMDREGKKIICYFTNWASYRLGKGRYAPENINSSLCTHIVYAFIHVDFDNLDVKVLNPEIDISDDFYRQITGFRLNRIKVLIALGGKYQLEDAKYNQFMRNSTAKKQFIQNLLIFIDKFNFDGLDLVWEFPCCKNVTCYDELPANKELFALFIKELSTEFKARKLLLSAVVSWNKYIVDKFYDVPILSEHLDWISVMTFNMHGHWEGKIDHLSPLYSDPQYEYDYFNANFSINYWIEKGAEASKLVMGIPMYGQSFTLANVQNITLQFPASGPGRAGLYTQIPGFLAFYEICEKVKRDGWNVIKHSGKRIGPYAVHEEKKQWVGYDDVTIILEKTILIHKLHLAGGMIWALDLDDFSGNCGCGKYPLLTAFNNGLRGMHYGEDCT